MSDKTLSFAKGFGNVDLCLGATIFWIRLYGYGQKEVKMNLTPVDGKLHHYYLESRDKRRRRLCYSNDLYTDYLKIFKNGAELKVMQMSTRLVIESSTLGRSYVYLDSLGYYPPAQPPTVCSA